MIFLDLETSGLNPYEQDIIEVGFIKVEDDPLLYTTVSFSLPFNEALGDKEAFAVNGWGKRKFAPMATLSEGISIFENEFRGERICCNNPAFDVGFLNAFMYRHGGKITWHHHAYDLKSIFAGWSNSNYNVVSTSTIVSELGIEPGRDNDGYHTALSDAKWNFDCYVAMGFFNEEDENNEPS